MPTRCFRGDTFTGCKSSERPTARLYGDFGGEKVYSLRLSSSAPRALRASHADCCCSSCCCCCERLDEDALRWRPCVDCLRRPARTSEGDPSPSRLARTDSSYGRRETGMPARPSSSHAGRRHQDDAVWTAGVRTARNTECSSLSLTHLTVSFFDPQPTACLARSHPPLS